MTVRMLIKRLLTYNPDARVKLDLAAGVIAVFDDKTEEVYDIVLEETNEMRDM